MELPTVRIDIYRGESYLSFWKIVKNDGTIFFPSSNDSVLVGIKRNKSAKNYIIKKTYTNEDFTGSGFYFSLTPDETGNLNAGQYEYDIGLKIYNEDETYSYYHIISVSPCIVHETVTLMSDFT